MIVSNPEFQRNRWLVLTPNRLVLMPLLLAAIYFVVYLSSNELEDFWKASRIVSLVGCVVLLFVLGLKDVSDSIIDEIKNKTWDSQRMTAVDPWEMVIGKLLGSTLYAWYGVVLCLAAVVPALFTLPQALPYIKQLLVIIMAGITCQATSLGMILMGIRKNRSHKEVKSSSYVMLILAAIMLFGIIMQISLGMGKDKIAVDWYGLSMGWIDFFLFSAAIFLTWSLVGCYRIMRIELLFQNGPWAWLLFLLTLMLYAGGFVPASEQLRPEAQILGRIYLAFAIAVSLTYLMAFMEPKNSVAIRKLITLFQIGLQTRRWRQFLQQLPLWALSLGASVVVGMIALATTGYLHPLPPGGPTSLPMWYSLPVVAFVMRDLLLLLYVNLWHGGSRADLLIVFYLILLYLLIPLIVNLAGAKWLLSFFLPVPSASILLAIVPVGAQVGLLLQLLRKRWYRLVP